MCTYHRCVSWIVMVVIIFFATQHDLQDGDDQGVVQVVRDVTIRFKSKAADFIFWQKQRSSKQQGGPALIAQHYKWALTRVFENNNSHAIIVEEDMIFSPGWLLYPVLSSVS